MTKKLFFLLFAFIGINTIFAQKLVVPPVDNTTFVGKAMFGYQGWFGHPNDNSPRPTYWHWGNMNNIGMSNLSVDMFPDMRELGLDERYPTAYSFPSGKIAEVFSSGNRQTVHRHMKWLRDYNTDGVWVQRFISEYGDKAVMRFRDSTTVFVQEGCEMYGRVFAIMYDGIANRVADIKEDWMHLVDDLGVTASDRYLHHNGKPIVSLWGYTVRTDATVDQLEELIDWFTNTADPKYRATIKLGVNDNWFSRDQRWLNAFKQVAVISPWSVGRYSNQSGYTSYINNQITPGLNWCEANNVLYVPVLFPGFSWYNLKNGTSPKNQIPRNGGNFFWMQVTGAMSKNIETFYFAMFDEVDESTAFFKTAENASQSPAQEYWLNLDADGYSLPSDWYLRAAGKAAETLRGNIPVDPALGTPAEGIMTIIPKEENNCSMEFIFPDFENETTIEISLDGGSTFPYSTPDNAGSLELTELGEGTYEVVARHPGGEHVPMGKVLLQLRYSDVQFSVNMGEITDIWSEGKVWLVTEAGERHEMTAPDTDSVFTVSLSGVVNSTMKYNFAYQNGASAETDIAIEAVTGNCADNNGYRVITFPENNASLTPYLFGTCDVALPPGEDVTDLEGTLIFGSNDDEPWINESTGAGSPPNERIEKLIDNDVNTKYLVREVSSWLEVKTNRFTKLNGYAITSANDEPSRDPKRWMLRAWNHNTNRWITLHDERSNPVWENRLQIRSWALNNDEWFSRYRLYISEINGNVHGLMQMAELQLFGEAGEFTSIELEGQNEISVYPNPATDQLYIDFNGIETGKARVSLFDIAGRIMSDEFLTGEESGPYRVNTTGIKSGLYLLKVETGQSAFSRKIIIR
jgi:hypothetical protein